MFTILAISTFLAHLLSPIEADRLATRIWQNECRGTLEGLTSWNAGEGHASLGIGHFIWYPAGKHSIFQETFPELMVFLEKEGVEVPEWQKGACPWAAAEEFQKDLHSPRMVQLRQFLYKTRDKQALFIAERLEKSLSKMRENLPSGDKEKLTKNFRRLQSSPAGLFAMIDYLNFKGDGTLASEQYQGSGWGLKQVLLRMEGEEPVTAFVAAAKLVLSERVAHAPKERNEGRWLKGWLNRVERYRITQ